MNVRPVLFVAVLALCACPKPSASVDAGIATGDVNRAEGRALVHPVQVVDAGEGAPDDGAALSDAGATANLGASDGGTGAGASDGGAGNASASDAGAAAVDAAAVGAAAAGGPCGEIIPGDGGVISVPKSFTGFSADGRRFAYSVYSEGAGGSVLTIIEAPNKPVKKILLDTPQATAQAKALLSEGGFTSTRRRVALQVTMKEVSAVVTHSDGRVVFKGTAFEGAPGTNTQASLWGCDPSGKTAALHMSTLYESEYGNASGYVLFDPSAEQRR